MMGLYKSPCDGCKHARWYDFAPDYGTCIHPTTLLLLGGPMVVKTETTGSIMRQWITEPAPNQCRTREDDV